MELVVLPQRWQWLGLVSFRCPVWFDDLKLTGAARYALYWRWRSFQCMNFEARSGKE